MYLKELLKQNFLILNKNVKANKIHDIVVLIAAEAIGSAPASKNWFHHY